MAGTPFKYKKQAIKDKQPSMNVPNVAAFLGDTFVSSDADKRICAGFFHLEKGQPLVYTYDYEEMKIVVEGTFTISGSIHAMDLYSAVRVSVSCRGVPLPSALAIEIWVRV